MQPGNLFSPDYEEIADSINKSIAVAKLKNYERKYTWSISILDELIYMAHRAHKAHPGKYGLMLASLCETMGDSYFAKKKYELAFICYTCSYHLKNVTALKKLLFTAKLYGHDFGHECLIIGFLLIIHSRNNFLGNRFENPEFLIKIGDLALAMDLEYQLYADVFIACQPFRKNVADDLLFQDDFFSIASEKYGADVLKCAYNNFYNGITTNNIKEKLHERLMQIYDKYIGEDLLRKMNSEIFEEFETHSASYQPLKRLDCGNDRFWEKIDQQIFNRTITEDINFKFEFAEAINTLVGNPAIIREIECKIGIYGNNSMLIGDEKFSVLFSNPSNIHKIKSVYQKIPIE